MAISKRPFIYATFILSCAAIALNVTSFATQVWVESPMIPQNSSELTISYGIFSGTLEYYIIERLNVATIYLTCRYDENACVWSCTHDAATRELELDQLIKDGGTSLGPISCTPNNKLLPASNSHYSKESVFSKRASQPHPRATNDPDQRFLNAALRVCTILFLAFALFFAVVAAVLAVVNSAMNPTEPILAIFGLYIWNGIAAFCDLIVLALWGAHFSMDLSENVAYVEVITGALTSDGLAKLGYSYWLILGSLLMHGCNLGILGVRKYLIDQEPPETTVKVEENNDGTIFLY